MSNIDFVVVIRSYGRCDKVSTLSIAPFAKVYVPSSQYDDYKVNYGDSVVSIPDECDGNLGRKNNYILDNVGCDNILIMDDDISSIGYWEDGERHVIDGDYFYNMVQHYFNLAAQFGVHMWGANQGADYLQYKEYAPFSFLAPILGPFVGHLSPTLRYDESMLGKDDYDFWLQNIRKYHKTLRVNKYHYTHGHGQNRGGFVSMRTKEIEVQGVERMRRKWGRYFKEGGAKRPGGVTGKNILNSKITVPINGV